ncbi:MAG: hypothetical protein D6723_14795 [Acidobacteria bacterium]|nr:MAG: hypothetical protein D6723_14795 [Acidobacteriota bacterium]
MTMRNVLLILIATFFIWSQSSQSYRGEAPMLIAPIMDEARVQPLDASSHLVGARLRAWQRGRNRARCSFHYTYVGYAPMVVGSCYPSWCVQTRCIEPAPGERCKEGQVPSGEVCEFCPCASGESGELL